MAVTCGPVIHVQFVAGTEGENAPDQPPELRLGRTLSYEEMALSALLSVRAVTCPLHVRYMAVTWLLRSRYMGVTDVSDVQ